MDLIGNCSLNYGKIICQCNLVDCVYMTKEYVENIKNNNYQEYICGIYEEGRYDWILLKYKKPKYHLLTQEFYNIVKVEKL